MNTKDSYTAEEMRHTLTCLEPIFDVVRLVDPADTSVLTLEADGTVSRAQYTCFQTWNRDCRCDNCTGMQALLGSCQRTKYEFILDNVFYVVSRPLSLSTATGEQRVVLEIVSRVSDQLVLDKSDGKSLAQRLVEIQERLYRDELTRAFNRRYLNEFTFLHRENRQVSRQVGVIMMDLFRFKTVNDTYGHLAGDQILAAVTRVLTENVRSKDSVIRLGGDEFLITLMDCDEDTVRRKTEELRLAVNAVTPADFGYAYTDEFESDPDFLAALLDQADRRMYEEKRSRKQ